MNATAHSNARPALRFRSLGTYRYLLYGVSVLLLVTTVVVMEWQHRSQDAVTQRMEQYHLMTVTRAAAMRAEVEIVDKALVARAFETGSSEALTSDKPFLVALPDTSTSLFLTEKELGKIVETQNVFRGLEFEELVSRTEQQFSKLKAIISDGLNLHHEVEVAQRQLTALTLTLEQLRRLHRSEHAKLADALPLQNRRHIQIFIVAVVSLLAISLAITR